MKHATITTLMASLLVAFTRPLTCHAHGHDGEVAGYHGQACSMPHVEERQFDNDVNDERARLIRYIDNKWMSNDVLHYYFFDNVIRDRRIIGNGARGTFVGKADQKDIVRKAFDTYRALDIGVQFKEVSRREDAEIRIGFLQGDGSWSYLGRGILSADKNQRTMNFGWDLTGNIYTAIHEIGHTLGFPHEHQNPNAGIVWNETAVYQYYGGYPNFWDRDKTYNNVLRKLELSTVEGSGWDPESVMGYPLNEGLILEPAEYRTGITRSQGLSEVDIATVRSFYPILEVSGELNPFEMQNLGIQPGEQKIFSIQVPKTRRYRFHTIGKVDSFMALYEEQSNGEFHEIASDDDSGLRSNALIVSRLVEGRNYQIKLRVVYPGDEMEGSILMW